jgi:hypothetical protein
MFTGQPSRNRRLYSLRRWLIPPLGVGLAVLLLTLPLWSYSAHREARAEHGLTLLLVGAVGDQSGPGQPADAPLSGHCAIHCAPQVLFVTLLLCAALLPLALPLLVTTAGFHARLGLPPLLPPPQTR